jgi:uncharacterized protein YerC
MNLKEKQYINRWAKIIRGIEYLGGKCIKCGETDPVLLDFHHFNRENKKEDVSRILSAWVFSECIAELNRCVLLCCKCHRKEHFDYEKFNNLKKYIDDRKSIVDKVKSRKKQFYENVGEAERLVKEGESFRNIHRITGITRDSIKRLASRIGVSREDYTNKIDINEEEFIKMYNAGINYDDICKHFSISKFPLHRIRKSLLDRGIIQRRKGKPSKQTRNLS